MENLFLNKAYASKNRKEDQKDDLSYVYHITLLKQHAIKNRYKHHDDVEFLIKKSLLIIMQNKYKELF